MSGHHYLSFVDRFSGRLNVYHYPPYKTIADTVISTWRAMFISYRIPEELSTDGGPQFMSTAFQNFFTKCWVTHRLSSVAYPQSNSKAELDAKTAKVIMITCHIKEAQRMTKQQKHYYNTEKHHYHTLNSALHNFYFTETFAIIFLKK